MRIVEASVFKDGHVLLRHEATARPDAQGAVTLEQLPMPVEGTYFPYVKTPGASIRGVVASRVTEVTRRDVATLAELLRANPGVRVKIIEIGGSRHEGNFISFLTSPDWLVSDPEAAEAQITRLPPALLVLQTDDGRRVVPLSRLAGVTLVGATTRQVAISSSRVRLRMLLDKPDANVTVGAEYLQKGIRWIPSYRMDLDGQGTARTELRATVINELADLADTQTRLVIGVPRIFNDARTDALGLQQDPKPLSDRFNRDALGNFGGFGGFGGGFGGGAPAPSGRCGGDDECGASDRSADEHQDLYYLPPVNLTLKKGETIQLPLKSTSLAYRDVYTVDVPFYPEEDRDRARGLTEEQRRELSVELFAVRAKHQIRLTNTTNEPLTTGPAAVFRDGRLAAHSLLLYTPPGASVLCRLGDAPDLEVAHEDQETDRVAAPPEPVSGDPHYFKISLVGKVTLTNRSARSLPIELTRNVPGNIHDAGGAEVEILDDPSSPVRRSRSNQPWVNRRTGSTRLLWKVTLNPGETREFPYRWHVYRR